MSASTKGRNATESVQSLGRALSRGPKASRKRGDLKAETEEALLGQWGTSAHSWAQKRKMERELKFARQVQAPCLELLLTTNLRNLKRRPRRAAGKESGKGERQKENPEEICSALMPPTCSRRVQGDGFDSQSACAIPVTWQLYVRG